MLINDLPTPNVSWTPFSPGEWQPTWSTSTNQNPFAQRQISKDESVLWPETSMNSSWLKFSPAAESTNRQENETTNPVNEFFSYLLIK